MSDSKKTLVEAVAVLREQAGELRASINYEADNGAIVPGARMSLASSLRSLEAAITVVEAAAKAVAP